MNICDCTLRDGGYYTNWDFDEELVKSYFMAMNEISAVTHLEIGYRSQPMKSYFGEYFYCPEHVLKLAKQLCPDKVIAIMLNEKNTKLEDLDELLNPCRGYVDLIRMAVDPSNIDRSIPLAREIKLRGFEVGFNLMYMSKWVRETDVLDKLKDLEGVVDYLYLVDSFGGIYPGDVRNALSTITKLVNIPLGFHGHNNLELGLANSLEAVNQGCSIIDCTLTGMGRGAGNLRTELFLTHLISQNKTSFDFNKLNRVVSKFENLKEIYKWGINLPYMISGAYSLPQGEVMSWISKHRYSTESIINALQNRKNNLEDNSDVPLFSMVETSKKVIVIGGGTTAKSHAHALRIYCEQNPSAVLIHAGAGNVFEFNSIKNRQFCCLIGSEAYKLQSTIERLDLDNIEFILEPSPRRLGTILLDEIINNTKELSSIEFMKDYPDSLLTICFQLIQELESKEILLFGFDGYDIKTDDQMVEVSNENQNLIDTFVGLGHELKSLTPTRYLSVITSSIYNYI